MTPTPTPTQGLEVATIAQAANDLVWDETHGVIYASVPSNASQNADSIAIVDPDTAEISDVQPLGGGSAPFNLAISDDGSFLYAGLDGLSSVQRFSLPAVEADVSYILAGDAQCDAYYALDLRVAPGNAATTAVSKGGCDSVTPATGGVAIYDSATRRPAVLAGFMPSGHSYSTLAWGANANTLYAANNETTGYNFYQLAVDPAGVTLANDFSDVFSQFYFRIHFDGETGLVYSDDGTVVDPATGSVVATFDASGWMVPDSAHGKAFFLGYATNPSSNQTQLAVGSYNLANGTPIAFGFLDDDSVIPVQFIRWGNDGLAFNTEDGRIVLMRGTFVSDSPSATAVQGGMTYHQLRRNGGAKPKAAAVAGTHRRK